MTEMQTRLCINLNQTYYRNWYCVWEAIYQLVYNWGMHGICQSNNFPVLRFLIQHQTVSGKTLMISFISDIFLFQIYPSVQGQISGRSSISFNGCDIEIHIMNWWQWCVDLTDCFPPIHSSKSLHYVYYKKEMPSKICPISD